MEKFRISTTSHLDAKLVARLHLNDAYDGNIIIETNNEYNVYCVLRILDASEALEIDDIAGRKLLFVEHL